VRRSFRMIRKEVKRPSVHKIFDDNNEHDFIEEITPEDGGEVDTEITRLTNLDFSNSENEVNATKYSEKTPLLTRLPPSTKKHLFAVQSKNFNSTYHSNTHRRFSE
jgi:hypothetical protein